MGGAHGIRYSIASYNGELVQPSNIIVIGNRKLLINCFSLNETEKNFALDLHTENFRQESPSKMTKAFKRMSWILKTPRINCDRNRPEIWFSAVLPG
jgi:hypothetical protein